MYDWEIERESYLKSDNTLMCKAVREFLLLRTGYRNYEERRFREESLITSSSGNIRIFENLMKYYKFFIRNSQSASSKSEIQTQLEEEEKQLSALSILDAQRRKIETKKTIYGLLDPTAYSHATDLYLALPLQYKSIWPLIVYREFTIRLSFRNRLLIKYGLFPWDYEEKLVSLDRLMYGFDPSTPEKYVELKAYDEYLKKHPEEAKEVNGDPKAGKADIFVRERAGAETSSSSAERSLPDPVFSRYLRKRLERLSQEAQACHIDIRSYLDNLILEKQRELDSERRAATEQMMREDQFANQQRQKEIEEQQRKEIEEREHKAQEDVQRRILEKEQHQREMDKQQARERTAQDVQRVPESAVAVSKTKEEAEQFIRRKIEQHKKERRNDWMRVWEQEAQEVGMNILDYFNERSRIYQLIQQEIVVSL